MNRSKRKWLAVGLIWTAVVGLTVWNRACILNIQFDRQVVEQRKLDQRYLNSKSAALQDVGRWNQRLTHRVASVDLGFLVVENNLKELSERFDLKKLQVAAQKEDLGTSPIRIQVSAEGSVPALVQWTARVEDAYPYLVVSKMEVRNDPHTHALHFLRITFSYHVSSEKEGIT